MRDGIPFRAAISGGMFNAWAICRRLSEGCEEELFAMFYQG
ncbi:hypothetical protein [Arthrobacter sp. ERGS1:01]|nr:hypothetical protein [Arthrobacter sp. ERGS1:01]